MAARYLLDTNVLSDMIRRPQGRAARGIAAVGEDAICTSVIVAAELRFGAAKSGSESLARRVDLVLSALYVAPLEPPADRYYADIRQHLARRGALIGPNDLLIAAQALSIGLTIVTANQDELSRMPGLGVENWLADES